MLHYLNILETCARAESMNWTIDGTLPRQYSMAIRETQYELSSLENTFLGPRWNHFFTATTVFDLYSISWILVTIFGQALAAEFPVTSVDDDYKFWVGIFVLITVPLSCTKVLDQVLLQFIFLAGRMLMVMLMLITILIAFTSGGEHFGEQNGAATDIPLFNLKNTMTIVQIAVFSAAFQFSVPSMAGISNDKKPMKSIFKNALFFSYASNCGLAIMMALYFGSSTDPSSNLQWTNYHGGNVGWSRFASWYIVLFAALDGLAIFPLLCTTLGGIILHAVAGDKASSYEDNIKIQILCRLLAALPQSIGALYVQDLGVVAEYGCIFTLFSYSVAPAMLYLASSRRMETKGLPQATFYTSKYFSHDIVAYVVLTLALLSVVGVALNAALY